MVQRRRFRIEDVILGTASESGDPAPLPPRHNEIMAELKAIRAEMTRPDRVPAPAEQGHAAESYHDTQKLLETYRAQIEQCEKLKVELHLIEEAINLTKQEIAVLHGKSFNGTEMAKVTGELGAVVGGTEEATQHILEAAEAIDQAAAALPKITSADQQRLLVEDIQERVVAIFEACNFQDLTGQRISKVMGTMKFIEHHINVMMDIWGGVDAIRAHAPPLVDDRDDDARLLNGPKLEGDAGHASQDDIDALFD